MRGLSGQDGTQGGEWELWNDKLSSHGFEFEGRGEEGGREGEIGALRAAVPLASGKKLVFLLRAGRSCEGCARTLIAARASSSAGTTSVCREGRVPGPGLRAFSLVRSL